MFLIDKQIGVMQDTLSEMKRSGQESTAQMWSAIENINWIARSMDLSQKDTQRGIELSQKTSRQTLAATVANFRREQRPWVAVESIVGEPVRGEPYVVRVFVVNTGKSPAESLRVWQHLEPHHDIPNVAALCRSSLASGIQRSNGLVNPGAGITLTLHATGGKALPGELEDTIGAGKVIYVYGCISYQDTFHAFHWLNFCSFWDNDRKEYSVCEKYNDAGDGVASQ
jgi:hypothetical protein